MTTLNSKAIQAKLVSIFKSNSSMKAISKMLTQEFSVEKTDVKNVFEFVFKNGTKEEAVLFDNRYLVISYAKPKGAKNDTIFLNKTVSMTSIEAHKVIVVDMQERSIMNGDNFVGFAMNSEVADTVTRTMATDMEMFAVRNYIDHTQLYITYFNNKSLITDNIKATRSFINAEILALTAVQEALNEKEESQVELTVPVSEAVVS